MFCRFWLSLPTASTTRRTTGAAQLLHAGHLRSLNHALLQTIHRAHDAVHKECSLYPSTSQPTAFLSNILHKHPSLIKIQIKPTLICLLYSMLICLSLAADSSQRPSGTRC